MPVILFVDRAGLVGNDGETHQGLFDFSFFRCIPNLTIMSPANFTELELMMDFAITLEKPVVIRFPRGTEDSSLEIPVKHIWNGKASILEYGSDISIVAIGKTVSKALKVSNRLKKDNISCEVINCRFLKPFDSKNIIKSIDKTKKVVVIEDGTIIGGLCSAIKETIIDNNLKDVTSKYFAYPDKFIPHGSIPDLEKKYQLDDESIYKNTIKMFK